MYDAVIASSLIWVDDDNGDDNDEDDNNDIPRSETCVRDPQVQPQSFVGLLVGGFVL